MTDLITTVNRALTAKEFQGLADVPPEVEWFANLGNVETRRAYENALKDFMNFTGIQNPEEFRKRCVRGFEKVIKECRHDQIKSVAVVAHGGTIMSIMDRYARDENGQPDGSYYDYQVKNGEGYELIIADVSSGDGRICAGSDIWRSGVAVSSGENDRSFDLRGGKNYKKLIP